MTYAVASSRHPLPFHAAGEVVGDVLDRFGGTAPALIVCFATAPLTGALDDIVGTIVEMLDPQVTIGATAVSVIAGAREIEEEPALALWAVDGAPPALVRMWVDDGGRVMVSGADGEATDVAGRFVGSGGTLLLLADPFSFPAESFLSECRASAPGLRVVGGLASAARGPGGNRLIADRHVHSDGAVGVYFEPSSSISTIVSQGCRPVGVPYTVTDAVGNQLLALAGRPATERLDELVASLDLAERSMAATGLQLGIVVDEQQLDFGRGDFLIRGILGSIRERGAIVVGDVVPVGATVQFQVRDAQSADEDLRALLDGRHAESALTFTCNGRGTDLFGRPDHDAALVDRVVDGGPAAGMFCAGEIGPIGGQPHLHGFTASVALFGASPAQSDE